MNREDRISPLMLPFLAAFVAVLAFLALLDRAYLQSGGVFEYPIQTPYAHLAVAEQMRQLNYGVTPGVFEAVVPSLLYPIFLLPDFAPGLTVALPMIWAGAGLVLAAALWGRLIWVSGYGTSFTGLFITMLGPLALHMIGVSFTGTEHIWHIVASLMILAGLIRFLDLDGVGRMLMLGVLLAPLFRIEGLLVSTLAALLVLAHLKVRAGVLLLILALGPSALAAYGFHQAGLGYVPAAFMADLAIPLTVDAAMQRVNARVAQIPGDVHLTILAALLAVSVVVFLLSPWRKPLILLAVFATAVYLVIGGFG